MQPFNSSFNNNLMPNRMTTFVLMLLLNSHLIHTAVHTGVTIWMMMPLSSHHCEGISGKWKKSVIPERKKTSAGSGVKVFLCCFLYRWLKCRKPVGNDATYISDNTNPLKACLIRKRTMIINVMRSGSRDVSQNTYRIIIQTKGSATCR